MQITIKYLRKKYGIVLVLLGCCLVDNNSKSYFHNLMIKFSGFKKKERKVFEVWIMSKVVNT